MDIVFDHVDFAYESFRRNTKNSRPENAGTASTDGEFALRDLCFSIASTESVAILGRSGSGKSTLMSLFTGLARPSRGRIIIGGRDILSDRLRLPELRRRIGLVFQFAESQLFETTVFDDVAYGPRNLGLAENRVRESVEEALASVGLPVQEFSKLDPLRLSQGEKRRAAIAGILAMQPEMLIMDEPTSGLDAAGRELLLAILADFQKRRIGLVIISHDTALVWNLAQRALALSNGRLAYDGALTALFDESSRAGELGFEIPRAMRLHRKLKSHGISLGETLRHPSPDEPEPNDIKETKQE
jgi:energy-coupling factor transport system ATP-binding protein